jgi:hypothetical protein
MERDLRDYGGEPIETQSAVSWGAVFAGAVAGLALSFVLLALAAGFGLSVARPWPGGNSSAGDFTPILGSWMVVVQVLSSALGGYLAGRLRTRWSHLHSHEAHFRDTAHGLLSWALSTVAGIILATAVLPAAAEHVTDALAVSAATMQRSAPVVAGTQAPPVLAEPPPAQVRAAQTEKDAAQLSLFTGVGLLLSAFIAAVCGAIGGLRRDEMHRAYWRDEAPAPRT